VNSSDGKGNKSTDLTIKDLKIENYDIYSNDTNRKTIVFDMHNYYYPLVVNVSVGSGTDVFSQLVNLSENQNTTIARVINYTTDGDKTVVVNASSASIVGIYQDKFNIKALELENYDRINYNGSRRIITFDVYNKWSSNLSVGWNLTDPIITNSTYLVQNQSVMVIIETNYTSDGLKEPAINAYSGNFSSSLLDRFAIHLLQMLDYQILHAASNTISEIIARSNTANRTMSWRLDTENGVVNSSLPIYLNESQTVMVFIENQFTVGYVYFTNASINSSQYRDEAQGVAAIP
jgi:hypothetical protein